MFAGGTWPSPLARHIMDIDLYHTENDKSGYNGGLFWHTVHYRDAGTSNHRTFPQATENGSTSKQSGAPGMKTITAAACCCTTI